MSERTSSSRYGLVAGSIAIVALVVFASGAWSRHRHMGELRQVAAEQVVRTVAVVQPKPAAQSAIELPGRIEAWARAPIYARVSGYLARWHADIGSTVKAGQSLADIEVPDLDQQLLQARAELETARSNAALAASTAQRWDALLASDSVSKQEADEKTGDLAARRSVVNALQANVERLLALKRFTQLTAPFDGVVTARNTDVGSLISVGGAAGSELFVVSDTRRLRIYVNVPQRQVASIRQGMTAQVRVPERPGTVYSAVVQSTSQAIGAATGGMLVQLALDNTERSLLPGGFSVVRFERGSAAGSGLTLPPSALLFGKSGVQVAVLDAAQKVLLKPVTIAQDLGHMIVLSGGVTSDDCIIASPPDGLQDGDLVRIAGADPKVAP